MDDFSAPELQPYVKDFLKGADFFWGHTFLARKAGIGYASAWADAHFADRAAKNEFYAKAGQLADPTKQVADLKELTPSQVLDALN